MSANSPSPAANTRAELRYIHALRVLACYLVIINHTHGELLTGGAPRSVFCFCLFFSLCKMGVTLFVMISGILLLDRDYGMKKIARCIGRVLLLLVGVTVLLALWQEGPAGLLSGRFLPALLAGPRMPPYWYLYALPGFYLVLPFLQKMARNFTLRDYALFTLLLLLLPSALGTILVFLGQPVTSSFSLALLPKFVTVAVAGKFVSLLPKRRGGMLLALALFLLAWGGSFASFFVPWLTEGAVAYTLDSWDTLPSVVMAGACVYLFGYFSLGERLGGRGAAVLRELAGTALGVYLLHPLFNHRVHEQGFILSLYAFHPFLGVFAHTLCLFLVCSLLVFLLRRIPFVRRIL